MHIAHAPHTFLPSHEILFSIYKVDRISSLGSRCGVVNILFRQYNVTLSKVVLHQRSSSVKSRFPSKVILLQRSSSVKGRLPSKVVFRQRSSSVKGRPLSKVIYRQKSSTVKSRLPSKVVFCQRSYSVKGRLLSNVSNIKGRLTFLDRVLFTILDFVVQTPPACLPTRFHTHKLIIFR